MEHDADLARNRDGGALEPEPLDQPESHAFGADGRCTRISRAAAASKKVAAQQLVPALGHARGVVGLARLAALGRQARIVNTGWKRIQAARGTAPALPLRPGQIERRTHDYRRHGTLDLFAALDVRAGTVIGACQRRRRDVEFRAFLDQVEAAVPPGLDVHLVLDNPKTHKTRPVHDWLVKRPRFHLRFTPTSASRLNLVECWFALLSRRRPERGAFASTADLDAAIQAYIAETNADPKPFVWTKAADGILASVARFCQRTSNSGHQRYLGSPKSGGGLNWSLQWGHRIGAVTRANRPPMMAQHTVGKAGRKNRSSKVCWLFRSARPRWRPIGESDPRAAKPLICCASPTRSDRAV